MKYFFLLSAVAVAALFAASLARAQAVDPNIQYKMERDFERPSLSERSIERRPAVRKPAKVRKPKKKNK